MVSIIIPVYNVEQYIEHCLKTVIQQVYNYLEIIIIDDGSTDNSGKICHRMAEIDNRISIIHQTNSGLSAARNKGIELSKGEFICFVDSDDYLSPYYVQILLETALLTNSDIVTCGFVRGKKTDYEFSKETVKNAVTLTSDDALKIWHGKYKDLETISWNKIYRRSIFENGLRYPVGMYFEDVPTIHRQFFEAKQITYIENKLYYYFQRKTSIMHAHSDIKIVHNLENQEERLDWFKTKKYLESYERLVSKCLKYYMVSYFLASNDKLRKEIDIKFMHMYKEKVDIFRVKDKIVFFVFIKMKDILLPIFKCINRK